MKVVLRSSSLAFTLLSIVLNAPITRVKSKLGDPEPGSSPVTEPVSDSGDGGLLNTESTYQLSPRLSPRPRV